MTHTDGGGGGGDSGDTSGLGVGGDDHQLIGGDWAQDHVSSSLVHQIVELLNGIRSVESGVFHLDGESDVGSEGLRDLIQFIHGSEV